jgi:hypothetical protein
MLSKSEFQLWQNDTTANLVWYKKGLSLNEVQVLIQPQSLQVLWSRHNLVLKGSTTTKLEPLHIGFLLPFPVFGVLPDTPYVFDSSSFVPQGLLVCHSLKNMDDIKISLTPYKLEISMRKYQPFVNWPPLEKWPTSLEELLTSQKHDLQPQIAQKEESKIQAGLPSPWSYSKKKQNHQKKWEEIDAAIIQEVEEDEKQNHKADPDWLFKQMYQQGDADSKKAMIKSMQESGGTCLSNSWSDASTKDYKAEALALHVGDSKREKEEITPISKSKKSSLWKQKKNQQQENYQPEHQHIGNCCLPASLPSTSSSSSSDIS